MIQCIGKTRVRQHASEKGELVQCTNQGEPTNPLRPDWGFLCASCAASRTSTSLLTEDVNVGGMQADPEEYRDQIASGFATGASRGYESSDE